MKCSFFEDNPLTAGLACDENEDQIMGACYRKCPGPEFTSMGDYCVKNKIVKRPIFEE